MRTSRIVVAWSVVPLVVTAVVVVLMYRSGYEAEYGSRAGAEPGFAGVIIAAPAAVLVGVQLLAFMGLVAARRRVQQVACLAVIVVAMGLALALHRGFA